MFYPHPNCKTDNYDIVNCSSDNVLCVLRKVLQDKRFENYSFVVVCYDESKRLSYYEYCKRIRGDINVCFLTNHDRIAFLKNFYKASIILTGTSHQVFQYKRKSQKVYCLNYFSPFKDDYYYIHNLGVKDEERLLHTNNSLINCIITTSDICSRIMANDIPLSLSKCLSLGFPRNDNFYNPSIELKKRLVEIIGLNFSKIICYTPTYRDYERDGSDLCDASLTIKKNVLGTTDSFDIDIMSRLLTEMNAIMIYKFHPLQEKSIVKNNNTQRIISYSKLVNNINFSLYDLLPISDVLITDYTSTSFDFLHANRPIIYYFYDYDKYCKNRGFSFDPIDMVCAGPVVYNIGELCEQLVDVMNNKDAYQEKRAAIHRFINKYHDDYSSDRILDLILTGKRV